MQKEKRDQKVKRILKKESAQVIAVEKLTAAINQEPFLKFNKVHELEIKLIMIWQQVP